MKTRLMTSALILTFTFGAGFSLVSAQTSDLASDKIPNQATKNDKTQSKPSTDSSKKSKSANSTDDLDAFFKSAEDEVKSGKHCFDDEVTETPKQTESKPIA